MTTARAPTPVVHETVRTAPHIVDTGVITSLPLMKAQSVSTPIIVEDAIRLNPTPTLIIEEPVRIVEPVHFVEPIRIIEEPIVIIEEPILVHRPELIIERPVFIEPIVEFEVVEVIHVLPPPVEEKKIEIKQIELEPAETTEGNINLPQLHYIAIEQIVPTEESPIDIP